MTESTSDGKIQSSLSSITRGASLYFIGRILANGLGFLLNLILTRGLGASLYGIYAYSNTVILFTVVLARFGTGKSLLRFIPAHSKETDRRNRLVGLAYLTALFGSILLGTVIYIFAPLISAMTLNSSLFVEVLRILSLIIPFNTIIKLTNETFRSLELLEYQVLIKDIVNPLTKITVVLFALLLGYSLLGIVAGLALAGFLVCIVSLTVLYRRTPIRPSARSLRSRSEASEFYNYSIPLTFKDIGSLLYTRIDILMVGYFLMEKAVGIYQISTLIAALLALSLGAFNQLFPPIASALYENGDINELESIYETVTRWILTISIPPALVAGVYSAELLAIFGPAFPDGALVLTFLTLGQLSNCAAGPSGFLLMMTDHQYFNMFNQWLLGALNVGLNYFLILEFGLIGAAIATASVLGFINIIRLGEVWYLEGLTPYSISYWKPVISGLIACTLMVNLSVFIGGYILLMVGTIAGIILFVALIILFGIEEDDREFFVEIANERLP